MPFIKINYYRHDELNVYKLFYLLYRDFPGEGYVCRSKALAEVVAQFPIPALQNAPRGTTEASYSIDPEPEEDDLWITIILDSDTLMETVAN